MEEKTNSHSQEMTQKQTVTSKRTNSHLSRQEFTMRSTCLWSGSTSQPSVVHRTPLLRRRPSEPSCMGVGRGSTVYEMVRTTYSGDGDSKGLRNVVPRSHVHFSSAFLDGARGDTQEGTRSAVVTPRLYQSLKQPFRPESFVFRA